MLLLSLVTELLTETGIILGELTFLPGGGLLFNVHVMGCLHFFWSPFDYVKETGSAVCEQEKNPAPPMTKTGSPFDLMKNNICPPFDLMKKTGLPSAHTKNATPYRLSLPVENDNKHAKSNTADGGLLKKRCGAKCRSKEAIINFLLRSVGLSLCDGRSSILLRPPLRTKKKWCPVCDPSKNCVTFLTLGKIMPAIWTPLPKSAPLRLPPKNSPHT